MCSKVATDADESVAERMNSEPAIFKGCSTTELLAIVSVATAFWTPICLLAATLFGAVTMGLGAAGVAVVGSVIVAAGVFQKLKAGRPDGFYQLRARCWLHSRGILKSDFIMRSGPWDIGRTQHATLSTRNR